jgi:small multidrug resistance family-3 protein
MKTLLLYIVTALAEILGCFLPLLWLRQQAAGWWALPLAGVALIAFPPR